MFIIFFLLILKNWYDIYNININITITKCHLPWKHLFWVLLCSFAQCQGNKFVLRKNVLLKLLHVIYNVLNWWVNVHSSVHWWVKDACKNVLVPVKRHNLYSNVATINASIFDLYLLFESNILSTVLHNYKSSKNIH